MTACCVDRRIVDKIPEGVKVVCIGEASHGTHDFYTQRAELTKLLIGRCAFTQWPLAKALATALQCACCMACAYHLHLVHCGNRSP